MEGADAPAIGVGDAVGVVGRPDVAVRGAAALLLLADQLLNALLVLLGLVQQGVVSGLALFVVPNEGVGLVNILLQLRLGTHQLRLLSLQRRLVLGELLTGGL